MLGTDSNYSIVSAFSIREEYDHIAYDRWDQHLELSHKNMDYQGLLTNRDVEESRGVLITTSCGMGIPGVLYDDEFQCGWPVYKESLYSEESWSS